jgi:SPOR domain
LRPAVGGSADGMPYWSVIVASDSGQAAAEASAASLRAHGFTDAFVVYSSDVPSLNSGYWVAASGKYSHRDDASAASLRAKDAGFSEAYPRCFGSSDTACGS